LLEDFIYLFIIYFYLTPRLWASRSRGFEGLYCLHLQGQGSPRTNGLTLKMKAVRSFETSGITLPTTRFHSHKAWMFICTTVRTCTFCGVRSCECDNLCFGRKACFYQGAWHHVLSVTGTPRHGACSGFGWRRRLPAMEGSCEYIQ